MMKHNVLYIFTDGSYLAKDRAGGWAALLWFNRREMIVSGSATAYGINEMEVMAAAEGLSAMNPSFKGQIVVVSDSKFLIERMNQKCSIAPDDYEMFEKVIGFHRQYSITWQWVKGHDWHPQNQRVDFIARGEAMALAKEKTPPVNR